MSVDERSRLASASQTLSSLSEESPQSTRPPAAAWVVPVLLLIAVYGLLGLTLTHSLAHAEIMRRCVLVDPNLARIWSVGNVEVGLSYLGVFFTMLFYLLRIERRSGGGTRHLSDLMLALTYLVSSFLLDYICVRRLEPFVAMLVGDAIVMTFTLAVSRQIWFQRLLGVFVPLVFLTCGVGHFLVGMSYWVKTYPFNTPWTMVTADIGFAVLVNAGRFPAFLRGEDVLAESKAAAARAAFLEEQIEARLETEAENRRLISRLEAAIRGQRTLLKEILYGITEGRLRLCDRATELPAELPPVGETPDAPLALTVESLKQLRSHVVAACHAAALPSTRSQDLLLAVGEAAMNAVVHATAGEAWVRADPARGAVQVWICDRGPGIAQEILHRATVERGFTTAGTLGYGFSIVLRTVDRVWLLTGSSGTTVVLEQEREEPLPDWLD